MVVPVTGIAVWAVVHLLPSVAPTARGHLIERLGTNVYRGSMRRPGNKASLFDRTASIGARSRSRPPPEMFTGGMT